jgi:pilus assembly protein Flp/PilA
VNVVHEVAIDWIKANWRKEDGQAMAEYGLILALIAVVVLVALTAIGTSIDTKFRSVVTGLGGVIP